MQTWITIVLAIAAVLIIIILQVVYEIHHLKVSTYNVFSDKLKEGQSRRLIFLTDLHLRTYGKNNINLIEKIKAKEPDYILLGGDMTTASCKKKDDVVINLLENLSKIAPVFYAPGNHEKDLAAEPEEYGNRYKDIKAACKKYDISYLENDRKDMQDNISVYGLDVDFKYYKRINPPKLTEKYLEDILPPIDKTRYNIMLAHNPKDFETYEKTRVDLILSGHFHGGVIRLPFGRGVITPRLSVNSNYTWGTFIRNSTRMIVSAGAGTHKVNVRLFNKPEIVVINLNSR